MEVLLVDDNIDYLNLMKDLLFANGFNVTTATDGLEGCEVLETSDIDLIISDIKMPTFDGLKLHAFARELERHKHTKFIFVSAYKDVYADMLTLNPACDYFLEKTMPAPEFIRFVNATVFGSFVDTWV
jgi:DNA-binding response OmpR family regulator